MREHRQPGGNEERPFHRWDGNDLANPRRPSLSAFSSAPLGRILPLARSHRTVPIGSVATAKNWSSVLLLTRFCSSTPATASYFHGIVCRNIGTPVRNLPRTGSSLCLARSPVPPPRVGSRFLATPRGGDAIRTRLRHPRCCGTEEKSKSPTPGQVARSSKPSSPSHAPAAHFWGGRAVRLPFLPPRPPGQSGS